MNYQQAWEFLDNLQFFKIKLGLDSMTGFLDSVDHPQQNLRFVHIAGTNGKGSVAITLQKILALSGYQVGLFTSPHLSSVRERFRINDRFISRADFARHATRIRQVLGDRQITYFEFTTALALLWFAAQKVDLVILEVGMGGRLDATNVIRPLVSVITNVTMDHEAYLGNTLSQVATEKAGIIKPGVPVVSGVALDVSREVVAETCGRLEAPLYLLGRDFHVAHKAGGGCWGYTGLRPAGRRLSELRCGLVGVHQQDNAALVLATLELLETEGFHAPEDNIRQGLLQVRWPARLEHFCLDMAFDSGRLVDCPTDLDAPKPATLRRFLIDGAHNPAGVASLKLTLEKEFPRRKLFMIWGSMTDKDATSGLAMLAPLCDVIIFTRPAGERSAEPESLPALLTSDQRNKAVCKLKVVEALQVAMEQASAVDLIIIAGSLYLAGETRKHLLGELVEHD